MSLDSVKRLDIAWFSMAGCSVHLQTRIHNAILVVLSSHFFSSSLIGQTISSPLGTQIPQAAGAAYKLKLQKKDAVAICFFG
jgi:hypothetical protein